MTSHFNFYCEKAGIDQACANQCTGCANLIVAELLTREGPVPLEFDEWFKQEHPMYDRPGRDGSFRGAMKRAWMASAMAAAEAIGPKPLHPVLEGQWTPARLLHLANAEQIDQLCFLLNSLGGSAAPSSATG